MIDDTKTLYIYMTRESFCMGDDVMAPNIERYPFHDTTWFPQKAIFRMVEKYIGTNLPDLAWRGFVNGERLVDVSFSQHETSFVRTITLVPGWQDLLREGKSIHFVHRSLGEEDSLPDRITTGYYTYEEAEELYKGYESSPKPVPLEGVWSYA